MDEVTSPDALARVAQHVDDAIRRASEAAGGDHLSLWLDVVGDLVVVAGQLADIERPAPLAAGANSLADPAVGALRSCQVAAEVLDTSGIRDSRAVMIRAALTDAIAAARRAQR